MNCFLIPTVSAVAFLITCLATYLEIPILKKKQVGQNIREDGPQSHLAKAGTPSMGGVAIIISVVSATVTGRNFSADTAAVLLTFVGFGTIGFFDDYLKVIKHNNLGLRVWQKFGLQALIAAVLAIYLANSNEYGTEVYIPFANMEVDFGIWYIPFIIFTVLAMVNAVNLTDGLDGLASGTTAITSLFFALLADQFAELSVEVFYAAILGGCLGFLVFNINPAKIFMGDTGSLALGGGLAAASIVMNMELFLLIAGFVYVLEALSVCIQVVGFKLTGKRVFRMAPLHHHFELGGMGERKVVYMFWAASAVFAVIGLIIV